MAAVAGRAACFLHPRTPPMTRGYRRSHWDDPLLRPAGDQCRVPARTTVTDRHLTARFECRFWPSPTAAAAAVSCPVVVSDRPASASGSRDREADCLDQSALFGL